MSLFSLLKYLGKLCLKKKTLVNSNLVVITDLFFSHILHTGVALFVECNTETQGTQTTPRIFKNVLQQDVYLGNDLHCVIYAPLSTHTVYWKQKQPDFFFSVDFYPGKWQMWHFHIHSFILYFLSCTIWQGIAVTNRGRTYGGIIVAKLLQTRISNLCVPIHICACNQDLRVRIQICLCEIQA